MKKRIKSFLVLFTVLSIILSSVCFVNAAPGPAPAPGGPPKSQKLSRSNHTKYLKTRT